MTALIAVSAFYLGMVAQYLIGKALRRLRRQTVVLRTPSGWRDVKLLPPEDIAEGTLRWQEALGVWEN